MGDLGGGAVVSGILAVLAGGSGAPSVSGGSTLVTGSNSRTGAGDVTATTSLASGGTVTGGATPYTYAWEKVSGDNATANNSTFLNTTFSRTVTVGVADVIIKDGIYRLKVTDANGAIAYGPNCQVQTTHSESS
jgi:hypothetical protein